MNERDDATSQKVNAYIHMYTQVMLFLYALTGSEGVPYIMFCPDVATLDKSYNFFVII